MGSRTRTHGPSFLTLPLGIYPYSHASKLRKTQWEKYGEKHMVYFCYVARIASLKTLCEKLHKNSLKGKRVQLT